MTGNLPDDEIPIYASLGFANTRWACVEDEICKIFCECVNPGSWSPAEDAFWAVVSFEGKLKMTNAALQRRLATTGLLDQWNTLYNRAANKSKKRNKLAHGSAVKVKHPNKTEMFFVPYYYKAIRGNVQYFPEIGASIANKLPDERLQKNDIDQMASSFSDLAKHLSDFLLALRAHNRERPEQTAIPNRQVPYPDQDDQTQS